MNLGQIDRSFGPTSMHSSSSSPIATRPHTRSRTSSHNSNIYYDIGDSKTVPSRQASRAPSPTHSSSSRSAQEHGGHSHSHSNAQAQPQSNRPKKTSTPRMISASSSASFEGHRRSAEIQYPSLPNDDADIESIRRRYKLESTSPILPKVKLPFPLIGSDDDDEPYPSSKLLVGKAHTAWYPRTSPAPSMHDVSNSSSRHSAAQPDQKMTNSNKSPSKSPRAPRPRTYSSSTTTTTTTRRTWTYSMPSSAEGTKGSYSGPHLPMGDDNDDIAFIKERRQSRISSTTGSPRRMRTSSPSAPPPSPSSSAAEWRTPSSPNDFTSPLNSMRARSFHGPSSSIGGSSPSVGMHRSRSGSLASSKRSVLPGSRSGSTRPFHGSRRSSSTTSTHHHKVMSGSATLSSRLSKGAALTTGRASEMFSKFGPRTLSTTPHFVAPVFSAFAFLVVSTMACFAIGSVLLSSLALTFYDDCGKRYIDVQKTIAGGSRRVRGSIEGVRSRVGRVVGGARDAVELVVWAAGARAIPTIILDNVEFELDYDSFSEILEEARVVPCTQSSPAPSEVSQSLPSTPDLGSNAKDQSPKNFQKPPTASPPQIPSIKSKAGTSHSRRNSTTSEDYESWTENDEDNLPYTVPFTTPRSSRSPSPERTSHQDDHQSEEPTLPPRPA